MSCLLKASKKSIFCFLDFSEKNFSFISFLEQTTKSERETMLILQEKHYFRKLKIKEPMFGTETLFWLEYLLKNHNMSKYFLQ
jgi:hypothetical protein